MSHPGSLQDTTLVATENATTCSTNYGMSMVTIENTTGKTKSLVFPP